MSKKVALISGITGQDGSFLADPKGWRFFQKTGGLTLLSRTIPELPLHPARK